MLFVSNPLFYFLADNNILLNSNLFILNKANEEDQFKKFDPFIPKYMNPTANNILRDNEILRIKDVKTRNARIDDILMKHQDNLRNEREQFIQSKIMGYPGYKAQQKKKFKQIEKATPTNQRMSKIDKKHIENLDNDNSQDMEQIMPGHAVNKKEDTFFSKFKEENKNFNDYSFEFIMKEIIQKNFLDGDHDMDLELKKFHDETNIIHFFFVKFNACSDLKLKNIFHSYKDKTSTFIDVISKTLIELSSFLQ